MLKNKIVRKVSRDIPTDEVPPTQEFYWYMELVDGILFGIKGALEDEFYS